MLLFLLGSTYAGLWAVNEAKLVLGVLPEEPLYYSAGLAITIFTFGPLFALILSHDALNREIENRTMRFLITKVKRTEIVMGKAFGHFIFWLCMLLAANVLIWLLSQTFSLQDLLKTVAFIWVFVAFALLLSLLVRKTILSAFMSLLLGIAIPLGNLWIVFSEKWYANVLQYLTPYYYIIKESYLFLVNFGFAIAFLLVTLLLLNRRDF